MAFFRTDGHVRRLIEIEDDYLRLAVSAYGSNLNEVARRTGLSRSTLYRKLERLRDMDGRGRQIATGR